MKTSYLPALLATILFAACASKPASTSGSAPAPAATTPAPASSAGTGEKVVKSRDGKFEGVIAGTPAPGSRFAKLQIGMTMNEVQSVMDRTPDRSHAYESGKRWIPFYFGNDARRLQAFYKGEGCLVFTDGNVWGAAGGDLIRIDHDPSGKCYQP